MDRKYKEITCWLFFKRTITGIIIENENETKESKETKQEEKKSKYVANKFTGLMHPYSYGLYTPKQARNQKKEPSNNNENDWIVFWIFFVLV